MQNRNDKHLAAVLVIWVIHSLVAAVYTMVYPNDGFVNICMCATGGINIWILVYFLNRWTIKRKTQWKSPKTWRWVALILGECPMCLHLFKYPRRRRLNTACHNDEDNFTYSCMDCYQANIEFYEVLWAEYNSSRM